jgi:ABC-type branched-subunit amino acid transport system ATPase component
VDPPKPHVLRQLGVGYLPQHRVVFEDLTIEENLEVCRLSAVSVIRELVPSVLGARLMERAGSLSGGERQLLGMTMVRAANPRLMILDEPMAQNTQRGRFPGR